jgi:hypothetical protein
MHGAASGEPATFTLIGFAAAGVARTERIGRPLPAMHALAS